MNRHIRVGAAGFSMVELLVTIIIAGIAFAALVPLFVSAQQKGAGAQYRSAAINLAQDRIERLRELPWSVLVVGQTDYAATGSSSTSPSGGLTWRDVNVGVKTYTVHLSAVTAVGSTQKTVTVSVTWYEQPGHVQKKLVLTTNIFRQLPGPQVIDVSFNPAPVDNWITSTLGTGAVSITATINPAQASVDCSGVRFTVIDASGLRKPFVRFVEYSGSNQIVCLDWGTELKNPPITGTVVPLHDGLYRVTAEAYSIGVDGQSGLPGNAYRRDIHLERETPPDFNDVFVLPGTVNPAVVNLLWALPPAYAPDLDYFQVRRLAAGVWTVLPDKIRSFGYKDTDVEAGKPYSYQVRAVDTADKCLEWTALATFGPKIPALGPSSSSPYAPTGVTPLFVDASVRVSWLPPVTSPVTIEGYHVYRDGPNLPPIAVAKSLADVISYSAVDGSVVTDPPTTYSYAVCSFSADGVESALLPSDWKSTTTSMSTLIYTVQISASVNKDTVVSVTDAVFGKPLIPPVSYTATRSTPTATVQVPYGNYVVTAGTKSVSVALTGDPAQKVYVSL